MAKLSAHDQIELARVEKEMPVSEDSKAMGTLRYRKTVALMSTGKILVKHDYWRTCFYSKNGVRHDVGTFSVKGHLKKDATTEAWIAHYINNGYTLKK